MRKKLEWKQNKKQNCISAQISKMAVRGGLKVSIKNNDGNSSSESDSSNSSSSSYSDQRGKSQSSSSKSVMKDKTAYAARARQSSVSVCDDDEDIEETSDRPEAIVLDVGVHIRQNIIPV